MAAKASKLKKRILAKNRKLTEQNPITLRRILLPIDFSEFSKYALRYAARFAHLSNASIDLIYVVEPIFYPSDFSYGQLEFPAIEKELIKRGREQLKNLTKDKVIRKKVVCSGKPFFEIIQYAIHEKIDLIIIASHGHSDVEQILFGSTAEKVIRKAPCPVLLVKTGERGVDKRIKTR